MADTISTMTINNRINVSQLCDKDRDIERGEVYPSVEVSSSSSSSLSTSVPRPASALTPTTSSTSTSTSMSAPNAPLAPTSLGTAVSVGYDARATVGGVGREASSVPAAQDRGQSARASANASTGAAARLVGDSAARGNSWVTIGRLIRRLTLAMLLLTGLVGALALVVIYMGPIYLVQLLIVISVAYFVSGGRLRWFYVAFKTLPRDLKGLKGYLRVMWCIRAYKKKNKNVADIFRQYASHHPNKACYICEDQEWTYQQIEDFSNKIATIFKQHYKKGDAIGLLMENRPEFVGIWLGLCKIGVITALINSNLRKNSLLHCINIAKCQALIYSTELASAMADITSSLDNTMALYRFGGCADSVVELKDKNLNTMMADVTATPPLVQEKINFDDKLLYIYTSGTTGLPKAAVITNARYLFIASTVHYFLGLHDSDRIYTTLPLYHTAGGVIGVGQALLHGHTTVIRKKFSASAFFNDCRKYKCTVAQYIGEMCRYILAVPPKKEDKEHNIRFIVGNGLRPQIWNEFVKRFNIPKVFEFYGATEGNANIANIDNTIGAVGFLSRIFPSFYPISIIKVDADGKPVRNSKGLCQVCESNEPGVFVGKIIQNNPVRAFLGYVDEKASEKKIVRDVFTKGDAAFISGDIIVADEFGYLYFKDRTGDTFRWKGENVSTSEIEAIISNLINYRDCIVYGVEIHGAEGRAGMAAIYDENSTLDVNKLSTDVKEQIPSYARPQFIRILTKIDLTGTFKLKKKDLQVEGYNVHKIQDKLYYLDAKFGYLLLTPEIYDLIEQGKMKF